jgi:inorganic pyrophosphatase
MAADRVPPAVDVTPGTTMRLDAIAIGHNPPEDVNVIIEVPIGGEPIKYEMDKAAGTLVVDRFLHTPMRYPGNYGFVPHTLSDDGDPIDVLVANTRPIVPGAVINVRPIGVLKMEDDGGGDEKIIAVPTPKLTKRYAHVMNYADMPEITLQQIVHFCPLQGSRAGQVGEDHRLGGCRRSAPLYRRSDFAGEGVKRRFNRLISEGAYGSPCRRLPIGCRLRGHVKDGMTRLPL